MKTLKELYKILTPLSDLKPLLSIILKNRPEYPIDGSITESELNCLNNITQLIKSHDSEKLFKFLDNLSKQTSKYMEIIKQQSHLQQTLILPEQIRLRDVSEFKKMLNTKAFQVQQIDSNFIKDQNFMSFKTIKIQEDSSEVQIQTDNQFQNLKTKYLSNIAIPLDQQKCKGLKSSQEKIVVKRQQKETQTQNSFQALFIEENFLKLADKNKRNTKKLNQKEQIQKQLQNIIYGKDLHIFLKKYLSSFNKKINQMDKVYQKLNPAIKLDKRMDNKNESQIIKESQKIKKSDLVRFLTNDNPIEQLSQSLRDKGIIKRLLTVCLDSLVFVLKNFEYFVPVNYLTNVIKPIQKNLRNMLKLSECQDEVNSYASIQRCCKFVNQKMIKLRKQCQEQERKSSMFNLNQNIEVQLLQNS